MRKTYLLSLLFVSFISLPSFAQEPVRFVDGRAFVPWDGGFREVVLPIQNWDAAFGRLVLSRFESYFGEHEMDTEGTMKAFQWLAGDGMQPSKLGELLGVFNKALVEVIEAEEGHNKVRRWKSALQIELIEEIREPVSEANARMTLGAPAELREGVPVFRNGMAIELLTWIASQGADATLQLKALNELRLRANTEAGKSLSVTSLFREFGGGKRGLWMTAFVFDAVAKQRETVMPIFFGGEGELPDPSTEIEGRVKILLLNPEMTVEYQIELLRLLGIADPIEGIRALAACPLPQAGQALQVFLATVSGEEAFDAAREGAGRLADPDLRGERLAQIDGVEKVENARPFADVHQVIRGRVLETGSSSQVVLTGRSTADGMTVKERTARKIHDIKEIKK